MRIYLIGYMGSGKSTLGRQLAKKMDYNYLDFDEFLEEKEGKKIAQIFKDQGEIYFRKKESQYLKELLTNTHEAIISLGGGTPCYGNNMELIKHAEGKSIYINVPVTELVSRLWSQKEHRPVLNHQDSPEKLEEFVRKHLFERSFYYNQADFKILADGRSELELVNEMQARLF
tara:strand:+ start:78 stop:596 length:519 start_codon:yes stop_codon:yes gene_type:complete